MVPFFIAALGGLFWAIVIVLDRIAVKNIFTHPMQAMVITCLMGTWGYGFLLFNDWQWPSMLAGIVAFLGGIALWASYYFYYEAMDITDEVSELAAWDAGHPMIIALLAIPLGLVLLPSQWLGMLLIIVSIILFQWHKGMWQIKQSMRISVSEYRLLLFANAFCMALTYLLMAIAVRMTGNYWDAYPLYITGVTTGLIVLLSKQLRKSFKGRMKNYLSLWWLFCIMEFCNVIAPLCITFASTRIHPAMAAALGATFPIYVAAAGPVARLFGASKEDFPFTDHLWLRISTLSLLAVGAGLLQVG